MTWDANGSPADHEYDCECSDCMPRSDCPTCGHTDCVCSASVGTDGVTAIDRSKRPWRVWRGDFDYPHVAPCETCKQTVSVNPGDGWCMDCLTTRNERVAMPPTNHLGLYYWPGLSPTGSNPHPALPTR